MTAPDPDATALMARSVTHLTTIDLTLQYCLWAQLAAARDAGAAVTGISSAGSSVPDLTAAGFRHIELPGSTRAMRPLADLRAALALWRILRAEKPDILHTHNPKPGLYGRIVGRLAGVPVVVNTVHGLYVTPDDSVLRRSLIYTLEFLATQFSHAELVQNEEDVATVRRLRVLDRHNVIHLGNGIDLDRFNPAACSPSRRAQLRQSLGVGDDQVLVGIVARFVKEKGYCELIEAAQYFTGTNVAWLAIGGRDPEKADSLDSGTMRRGEGAGFRFLDFQADVRDFYAAMDIVVLPSYREGIPRSLMEGAAMGKPLVATDIRGCRQVVLDGVNGRLAAPKDPRGLRDAIAELVADPDRRAEWGRASRRVAEDRFDERDVVARVLQTYVDLLRVRDGHARRLRRPGATVDV